MISKLIVYGKDRNEAIEKSIEGLNNYEIAGFSTTNGFCRFVLNHEEFRNGSFTINFVEDHYEPEYLKEEISEDAATGAKALFDHLMKEAVETPLDLHKSSWKHR